MTVVFETNELVQIATLTTAQILEIKDPFAALDHLHSPLYTYPFFGEEETWTSEALEQKEESDSLDLKIIVCVNVDYSCRPDSALLEAEYFLAATNERVLEGAMEKIDNKMKELAENANIPLRKYSSWHAYQDACRLLQALPEESEEPENGGLMTVKLESLRARGPAFYGRLQLLLPFFIEAATPIDLSDSKWSIYILKDSSVTKGILTAYDYFRFPEGLRTRVSQVFVFPPFQHSGLGTHLYREVCSGLRAQKSLCREICVEDPTDEFERLRALCDWEEAQRRGIWKEGGDADVIVGRLTKEMLLSKSHAERLIILNWHHLAQQSKPAAAKKAKTVSKTSSVSSKLRKQTKKWLLMRHERDLPESRSERLEKLQELYEGEREVFIEPLLERIEMISVPL